MKGDQKINYLKKFRKALSVLLCTVLFTVPVMAGGLSAKEISTNSTYSNIKEVSISENGQKAKLLSENDQYKELEKNNIRRRFQGW